MSMIEMRLCRLTKPLVFGLGGVVLLAGAVWLCASQVNRRAAGSVVELNALLKLPPAARDQVDIARMNLLCAQGLPGAKGADLAASLAELDRMAGRVRSETERHLYRFQRNPAEFENSEGFFRMVMLAVVLAEDFGVRYAPGKIGTPAEARMGDGFFADARDVFLLGLLSTEVQSLKSKVQSPSPPSPSPLGEPQREMNGPLSLSLSPFEGERVPQAGEGAVQGVTARVPSGNSLPAVRVAALRPALNPQLSTLNLRLGTCSSLPVLQVAVGRRLGYPLKLVTTKGHLFVRWEDAHERFNIEAAGNGVNRFTDDYYRHWPMEVAPAEEAAEGYLKSLMPQEELAVFLSIRGMCLREAGQLPEAVEAFAAAARLAPACRGYQVMLASLQGRHAPSLSAVNPQAAQTITKDNKPNL